MEAPPVRESVAEEGSSESRVRSARCDGICTVSRSAAARGRSGVGRLGRKKGEAAGNIEGDRVGDDGGETLSEGAVGDAMRRQSVGKGMLRNVR